MTAQILNFPAAILQNMHGAMLGNMTNPALLKQMMETVIAQKLNEQFMDRQTQGRLQEQLGQQMQQDFLAHFMMQQQQQRREKIQQNNWRNLARQSQDGTDKGDPLVAMLLAYALFGGLFDCLPLAAHPAAGLSTDFATLAQFGMGMTQHNAGRNAIASVLPTVQDAPDMGTMLLTLLMQVLGFGETAGGKGSAGGEDMLAADPLRHPKMARFKQNRHSISCVKTSFKRQMGDMMEPQAYAPRYAM